MKAFLFLLKSDFILQYRQKLWLAAGVVTSVYIAVLFFVPQTYANLWISALLFNETCTLGLMLIAGNVFLEKRLGSIFAFVVTPMPTNAWILSKLVSLATVSTVLGCAIVLFKGEDVNWFRVVLAIGLSAALYTLLGFIIAAPVRKGVNQFFVPMAVAMAITSVPIVWHLGILEHPAMWLIPSYPAMILLSGCLRDMPAEQFYAAAGVLVLWILAEFYLSTAFFHRYVSERRRAQQGV